MKYFIDTEFLEGTQKEKFPISLFRKNTPNTIDLISIGIVSEDGREYYSISKDFNLKEAWNRYDIKHEIGSEPETIYWIRDNVLRPIFDKLKKTDSTYDVRFCSLKIIDDFNFKHFKYLINKHGKTNKEIALEIVQFIYPNAIYSHLEYKASDLILQNCSDSKEPEFYTYYTKYNWKGFCWLFEEMIGLSTGFPLYCAGFPQILEDKATNYTKKYWFGCTEKQVDDTAERSIKCQADFFQIFSNYSVKSPQWNKQLFEFLNNL